MSMGINSAWMPPQGNGQGTSAGGSGGLGSSSGSIPEFPCLYGVGGLLMNSGLKFTEDTGQEGMQA